MSQPSWEENIDRAFHQKISHDSISFIPLSESDFSLLYRWLMSPHVRAWWDQDIDWTPHLIEQKFSWYVKGIKRIEKNGQIIDKPMHAFIIKWNTFPIGYIQFYNRYDFLPVAWNLEGFPLSLASLDILIGEESYTGKGSGSLIIEKFLKEHVFKKFSSCFVNPDLKNVQAIKAYKNAGFKEEKISSSEKELWMIASDTEHA